MKKWLAILFLGCLWAACDEQALSVEEYPHWVKISVPNGREAYAIAGDIEETLLVATHTKAFYTTDMGQTWVESKDFQGPVRAFLQRQDTVVALFAEAMDGDQKIAKTGYLYTLNLGRSWHYDETGRFMKATAPIGVAVSDFGVKYRIRNIADKNATNTVLPSFIEKWPFLDNQWGALEFPLKVKANNLHLDGKERLYVAATSGTFNEENCLQQTEEKAPAWIFISKRPLPQ